MADGVAAPADAPAPPSDDPTAPAHACRNCGAHATGHYCANCGQETRVALPTFGAFMREAAGRYVALDGRLWRTLFALVARPGFLTLEYFSGRRRRYIRPARLFLVLYLLLFAVIGLLQSPLDLADEVVFVDSDKAGATNPAAPALAAIKRKAGSGTVGQGDRPTPTKALGGIRRRGLKARCCGWTMAGRHRCADSRAGAQALRPLQETVARRRRPSGCTRGCCATVRTRWWRCCPRSRCC